MLKTNINIMKKNNCFYLVFTTVRQNKLMTIQALSDPAIISKLFKSYSKICDSRAFSYCFSSERRIWYEGRSGNYILYNPENFSQENFCNFIINNFSLNSTYYC